MFAFSTCVCVHKNNNRLIGDTWKTAEEDNRVQTPTIFSNLIWAKLMENYRSPSERRWETLEQWTDRKTDRLTDGRGVTVVLFSSPVWCTAACHWSAVCAYPSKESSSSWLLPLSLYLEAIQVLLSEKWTDKKRCVSGWEKNGGEHFSANLWSPHTLNKALKDTERSDDISVVGEDEPSHPSFMLTKSLQCNSDTPLSFLQVQLWSSKNASKINSTTQ